MNVDVIGVVVLSLIGLLDGLMICMKVFLVFFIRYFVFVRLCCGSCVYGFNSIVLCFGMLVMNICKEIIEFGGIEVVLRILVNLVLVLMENVVWLFGFLRYKV